MVIIRQCWLVKIVLVFVFKLCTLLERLRKRTEFQKLLEDEKENRRKQREEERKRREAEDRKRMEEEDKRREEEEVKATVQNSRHLMATTELY